MARAIGRVSVILRKLYEDHGHVRDVLTGLRARCERTTHDESESHRNRWNLMTKPPSFDKV